MMLGISICGPENLLDILRMNGGLCSHLSHPEKMQHSPSALPASGCEASLANHGQSGNDVSR